MNRFLSIIYLYHKASWQRLILVMACIPSGFLIICFCNVGILTRSDGWMLLEHAFKGLFPVLLLVGVLILGLLAVANTLNKY